MNLLLNFYDVSNMYDNMKLLHIIIIDILMDTPILIARADANNKDLEVIKFCYWQFIIIVMLGS